MLGDAEGVEWEEEVAAAVAELAELAVVELFPLMLLLPSLPGPPPPPPPDTFTPSLSTGTAAGPSNVAGSWGG
jgi:hypothetical protein